MWKLDKHFCPSLSFHIILFFYCFLTNKQKCCSSLSLNTVLACLCSYVPLVYFVFHFNRYFLLIILLFIPCVPHVNSQIFYPLMTVMDFRLFLFCIRKASYNTSHPMIWLYSACDVCHFCIIVLLLNFRI